MTPFRIQVTEDPATRERLNPYARFLGAAEPLAILRSTAATLTTLIGDSSTEQLVRPPAADKWSIRDILCHLADTELVFGFRLRQTVAEPQHVIQPYDQGIWANHSSAISASQARAAFAAIRTWNLLFIDAVGPAASSKPVTHPERGPMTFGHIVETMAGHDINHTLQIRALL